MSWPLGSAIWSLYKQWLFFSVLFLPGWDLALPQKVGACSLLQEAFLSTLPWDSCLLSSSAAPASWAFCGSLRALTPCFWCDPGLRMWPLSGLGVPMCEMWVRTGWVTPRALSIWNNFFYSLFSNFFESRSPVFKTFFVRPLNIYLFIKYAHHKTYIKYKLKRMRQKYK